MKTLKRNHLPSFLVTDEKLARMTKGHNISGYQLLRFLGLGGQAEVWLALAPSRAQVAIKFFDTRSGYDAELHICSLISQLPDIDRQWFPTLIDQQASTPSGAFIAMEFIDGVPIDEFCEHAGLKARERVALIELVCRAVGVLHRARVFHRDLTPKNVLVVLDQGTSMSVRVIDFGIAIANPHSNRTITRPHDVFGSYDYMAPQLVLEGTRNANASTEVYSIGALLYKLLTGQTPIGAALGSDRDSVLSQALGYAHGFGHPDPDAFSNARHLTLDASLKEMLLAAVHRDPNHRYRSVEEFQSDLAKYLDLPLGRWLEYRPKFAPPAGVQAWHYEHSPRWKLRLWVRVVAKRVWNRRVKLPRVLRRERGVILFIMTAFWMGVAAILGVLGVIPLITAIIGGFTIVAIFVAAAVAMVGQRIGYAEEVNEGLDNVPLLGILPRLPDKLTDPEQAAIAAHCIHQIRAMLQLGQDPARPPAYMITSASSGDGRTSLTMALGLSFAASGSKTLIIDCDLVTQGLTSRLKASNLPGLVETFSQNTLRGHVRKTATKGLYILPVGCADAVHAGSISPEKINRLLSACREHFDHIIIDTGPILGCIVASAVAPEADGVIVAVARGQHQPLVEKAIKHLRLMDTNILGIVFNRAEHRDLRRSVNSASIRSTSSLTIEQRQITRN